MRAARVRLTRHRAFARAAYGRREDLPGLPLGRHARRALPDDPVTDAPADWCSPAELEVVRLSSTSHWDVPIEVGVETVHFLVSHPTPPTLAKGTKVVGSGIPWPVDADPLYRLTGDDDPTRWPFTGVPTSDHRQVWVDLRP